MNVGREDKVAYTWFINTYLRKSVPRSVQRGLLNKAPSTVFTISDEAIVLWYMENSWEVWEDMKARNDTKNATIATRYTVSGDKAGGDKGDAGWSEEGKVRYNQLFDIIAKERDSKIGKDFDAYYLLSEKPTDVKAGKKVKQSCSGQHVTAKNTLSILYQNTTAMKYNDFNNLEEGQEMDDLSNACPYDCGF